MGIARRVRGAVRQTYWKNWGCESTCRSNGMGGRSVRLVLGFCSRKPHTRQRGMRLRRENRLAREPCSICSRSEEHTSELQSHSDLVCRLLLEKKKKKTINKIK